MAWRHPYPGDLKLQILTRVADGETISAIGAEPGMPGRRTISAWAEEDPGFRAMLADARRKGRFRRVLAFDEDKARQILHRLGAGETIRDVLRDPAMPGRKVFDHWKRTQHEFAGELHRLRRGHYTRLALISRDRARAFDWARADKLLVRLHRGERLRDAVKADPDLPGHVTIDRWRKENPEFDRAVRTILLAWARRRRRGRRCTPQLTARIVDKIAAGGSLWRLSREPGMPAAGTLYRWMLTLPDFAAAVDRACDIRDGVYQDQMRDLMDEVTEGNAAFIAARMRKVAARAARHTVRPGQGRWRRR